MAVPQIITGTILADFERVCTGEAHVLEGLVLACGGGDIGERDAGVLVQGRHGRELPAAHQQDGQAHGAREQAVAEDYEEREVEEFTAVGRAHNLLLHQAVDDERGHDPAHAEA